MSTNGIEKVASVVFALGLIYFSRVWILPFELWLFKYPNLLVRAMYWPLIWPQAVAYAKTRNHSSSGVCVACHAKSRLEEDKHQPTNAPGRTVVCRRCGLPSSVWERFPKCKGRTTPSVYPDPKLPDTSPTIIRANWD